MIDLDEGARVCKASPNEYSYPNSVMGELIDRLQRAEATLRNVHDAIPMRSPSWDDLRAMIDAYFAANEKEKS